MEQVSIPEKWIGVMVAVVDKQGQGATNGRPDLAVMSGTHSRTKGDGKRRQPGEPQLGGMRPSGPRKIGRSWR